MTYLKSGMVTFWQIEQNAIEEVTMRKAFPSDEMSRSLSLLRSDLLQTEKRIAALLESVQAVEADLLRHNERPSSSPDDALVARIVDGVSARLGTTANSVKAARKEYLREKEVAQYMGVSVFSLRSWRSKGSTNGPPFVRIGKMVLYPVAELENHMLKLRGTNSI